MKYPWSHVLHRKAAAVKDSLVRLACFAGFVSDPQTVKISGYQADFRVTTPAERWRVQQQMRETEVLKELLEEIKAGDCFWDVGAAVGTYSCLAADAGAQPIAFEPHPKNYDRCVENMGLNDIDASVHRFALSDRSETLKLPADGAIGTGTFQLSKSGDIEVETVRGDEVGVSEPDVMKIDVEGHEIRVLRGMDETLNAVRTIFIECHPDYDVKIGHIRTLLSEHGFQVDTIELSRREPYVVGRRAEADDT